MEQNSRQVRNLHEQSGICVPSALPRVPAIRFERSFSVRAEQLAQLPTRDGGAWKVFAEVLEIYGIAFAINKKLETQVHSKERRRRFQCKFSELRNVHRIGNRQRNTKDGSEVHDEAEKFVHCLEIIVDELRIFYREPAAQSNAGILVLKQCQLREPLREGISLHFCFKVVDVD